MNWFSLISFILAMSPRIVQSVETIAAHKNANGQPMSSADKAAAGVSLGQAGLAIAGVATGEIPPAQVGQLIQAVNDSTVAASNAQVAATQTAPATVAAPTPAAAS